MKEPMRRNLVWCLTLLIAVGMLAGCGSSATTAKATTAKPSSSKASSPVVDATDTHGSANRFSPKTITISVGQAVTFVNTGSVPHTATADPGSGTWTSGELLPGKSYTTPPFMTPGTYSYHCLYHQTLGMVGSIIVKS